MNESPLISKEAIKRLLLENQLFVSRPDELNDDSLIMMDSLCLIWFLDMLEHRNHIHLQLEDGDYERFDSIHAIYRLIQEKGVMIKRHTNTM
ncbi:hypothetical protein BBD42_18345 [Paenibacillus sp. BIHB 4019]|uniref:Carrier domain-containing protein n=1 Tax=Paenibacillus sp. BIHB 4019 TaxID=1870819 RepID=A0A1B2DKI3_9BACL|nr:hypothetical protein BBD42_18345 [Paenibacillus sp. BIHB 4019]